MFSTFHLAGYYQQTRISFYISLTTPKSTLFYQFSTSSHGYQLWMVVSLMGTHIYISLRKCIPLSQVGWAYQFIIIFNFQCCDCLASLPPAPVSSSHRASPLQCHRWPCEVCLNCERITSWNAGEPVLVVASKYEGGHQLAPSFSSSHTPVGRPRLSWPTCRVPSYRSVHRFKGLAGITLGLDSKRPSRAVFLNDAKIILCYSAGL